MTAELIPEDEAARRLMMSPRTLRDLRQAGLIRYVRLTPRKIAYRPEDCDEYVASCVRVEVPRSESPKPRSARGRTGPSRGVVVPFSQRKRAGQ